jgi:hypothetical protein
MFSHQFPKQEQQKLTDSDRNSIVSSKKGTDLNCINNDDCIKNNNFFVIIYSPSSIISKTLIWMAVSKKNNVFFNNDDAIGINIYSNNKLLESHPLWHSGVLRAINYELLRLSLL